MRGDDQQLQAGTFSYVALEDRIPADHPLRGVKKLVDTVLARMTNDFDGLYSGGAAIDSARACAR
jgi:transposase